MTISVFEFDDYRDYLKSILKERKDQNASYSLGSFSRDLNVNKGQLSFVLQKKRSISYALATKITKNLKLTAAETTFFNDLVTITHSKSEAMVFDSKQRIHQVRNNTSLSHAHLSDQEIHVCTLDSLLHEAKEGCGNSEIIPLFINDILKKEQNGKKRGLLILLPEDSL